MFTGLIQGVGTLVSRAPSAAGARAHFACPFDRLELGESVAVSGACLTVASISARGFEADLSPETLSRTTLGALSPGGRVNLERALAAGERLGGHLVTGHVDGTTRVLEVTRRGDSVFARFECSAELARYVAAKGSVALDGVSLTVNDVNARTFSVMLIPHTLAMTTLADLAVGSLLNLEVDLVARYVARFLETEDPSNREASLRAALARAGMA
jgi:riboflavin synthase